MFRTTMSDIRPNAHTYHTDACSEMSGDRPEKERDPHPHDLGGACRLANNHSEGEPN